MHKWTCEKCQAINAGPYHKCHMCGFSPDWSFKEPENSMFTHTTTTSSSNSFEDGFAEGYSRGWTDCWNLLESHKNGLEKTKVKE
jgi:hypothetical protein